MTTGQQQSVLDQFAKRAKRLYSLPAVAMKVVELTRQPHIDTQALKACLENDPALSTKVLRVVNSSLFGLSQKVADLNQALAILGTKPLKLLVLGFSLPRELLSDVEANVLNRYWRQALTKAVAAREISETIWDLPGDEPFIAGLLQDIGMLALVQDLEDTYVRFLERVYEEGEDLAALELSTLGFDHGMLSARMLRHWGLPDGLVRAVALPRDTKRLTRLAPQECDLPQILHLACLVTDFLIQQSPVLLAELLETGRLYKGLTESQLEAVVASLGKKVPTLADVLSLQLPDGTDYCDILLSAYRQLSEAADDVTPDLFGEASRASAILPETDALSQAAERLVGIPLFETAITTHASTATAVAASPATVQDSTLERGVVRPPTDEHGLLTQVTAAVGRCRQSRCAISLLLAEVDDFATLLMTRGVERASQTVHVLASVIEMVCDREGQLFQMSESRLALILEEYDRPRAVGLARQLLGGVRDWSRKNRGLPFSISAGLAASSLPPKNFPAQALVDAADRCLNGVQLSSGDGVKSIDIY